ncbi:MAG: NAD+ synthase [Bacillota bacterium]
MKIAAAQINPTVGDLQGNTRKISTIIKQAGHAGADLVIFPEMALTGYPPRDLLLYGAFLDEVERIVHSEILPLTTGTAVLLGAPWREENGEGHLFNAALLLTGGSIVSRHAKTLLPNYDVFDERRYFVPAPSRRPAVINGINVAVTICEDVWNDKDYWERRLYPEDPVEELFAQGACLLINISASPYHLGKAAKRERMLCAMARKYGAPLLYINQVGGNDELIFDGSSLLCSGGGRVLYRAEPFKEEIVCCEFAEGGLVPVTGFGENGGKAMIPGLEDRGLPAGAGAEEGVDWIYGALQTGLRDYLHKNEFSSVVIGLSGGIDSAVTAALAVQTLGAEKVLGVLMPSRYSSHHSVQDSLALAQNLGIKTRTIPIEDPFGSFLGLLNEGKGPHLDLAEENIQARIRGNILMFISNREKRMVLTTGNKSELAVGYCTLYGDMCGGLAVLADVPKTMVYRLAVWINERAGREIIPGNVINKEPSAELRPEQKDRDALPPYELLDRLLHLYIEENRHVHEIVALGYKRELVENIVGKIDRAEYKRFQAAPGLRVTTRAFGSGRRMPLARGYFHLCQASGKKNL